MGSFSIWHWMLMTPIWLLFVWPTWRLCERAGISGPWALLFLIPPLGLILVWIIAFIPWPIERQTAK